MSAIPTLKELVNKEASLYQLKKSATMKWLDQDNDLITLSSDDDVAEAFNSASRDGSNLVRIQLILQNIATSLSGNFGSPITTVADNPITTVPINAITNAPTTTVPITGITSNVSPVVGNLDGNTLNNNFVSISGVTVNTNTVSAVAVPIVTSSAAPSPNQAPFVTKDNSKEWMPMIAQFAMMGFVDSQRNVDLLNHFNGNYLCTLCQLVQDHARSTAQQQ